MDEPSWDVNCGPNLKQLIAKVYTQIGLDVSVDVSDVWEANDNISKYISNIILTNLCLFLFM